MLQQINNLSDLPNVTGDSGFHRWCYSQGFVNPAEIIVHEMKRNRVFEIFDFLGESISQSRESPVHHSHGQVLALDVARRNVAHVGVADHRFTTCMENLWWAVSSFVSFALSASVELNEHSIIDIGTEGIFNRAHVGSMTVGRELDTVRKPTSQVVYELKGVTSIAFADEPARNKFCVRINGDPRPNVANAEPSPHFVGYVLFLCVAKIPNFITLNPLARKIAQYFVLVFPACLTDLRQKLQDGIKGNVGHAGSSAHAVTFNDCPNNLNLFLFVQSVPWASIYA
jgi:hypothetical protein